jgi:hypothetical protein|tara:strand:+ start:9101 stop:9202 length:102 start_codon:yes stop_codon:yes gene_type:complete
MNGPERDQMQKDIKELLTQMVSKLSSIDTNTKK